VGERGPTYRVRRTLRALPRPLCRRASIILPGDDACLLAGPRNVVAYVCRHSPREVRHHGLLCTPQPAIGVLASRVLPRRSLRHSAGPATTALGHHKSTAFFSGNWRRGCPPPNSIKRLFYNNFRGHLTPTPHSTPFPVQARAGATRRRSPSGDVAMTDLRQK
jgi:hypothetical protein